MCKAKASTSIFVILILFVSGSICLQENDKRIPPKILDRWDQKSYYQEKSKHNFTCFAVGSGLRYELYKDDISYTSNSSGHFTLEDQGFGLDGTYQCKVKNQYGVAVTDKTNLIKAVTVEFPRLPDNRIQVTNLSDNFSITCSPKQVVVPDPIISWFRKRVNGEDEKVQFSREVQFDGKDTLHFANAEHHIHYLYWCSASNQFLRTSGNSTQFKVDVQNNYRADVKPALLTSSSSPPSVDQGVIVGFMDGQITLRCLFKGYPTPMIRWLKGNQPVSSNFWTPGFDNTEITSRHPLNQNYSGVYTCEGFNNFGTASHVMTLAVHAPPLFLSESDGPMDTVVVNGGHATFNCTPRADPPATVKWFRNGILLNENNLPAKYSLNNSKLSISDVCNNCAENDHCVIRCQASNSYGQYSAEGFLAVIDPTTLDEDLYKDVVWKPSMTFVFPCLVTYDRGFPGDCSWYHNGSLVVDGVDNRLRVDENGTLTVLTEVDKDVPQSTVGNYTVVANNNYSKAEKSFRILYTDATAQPMVKPSGSLWWISLIVLAIILLLLLLLLLLWCCRFRRRDREDYPVDKKERQMGHDPVKELHNLGFKDYQAQSGGNISYTEASANHLGDHKGAGNLPSIYYTNGTLGDDAPHQPYVHNRASWTSPDDVSYGSIRFPGNNADFTDDHQVIMRRDSSVRRGDNHRSAPTVYRNEGPNGVIDLDASLRRHTYDLYPPLPYNPEPFSEV